MLGKEFAESQLEQQQKARVTDWVSNWARGRGTAKYLLNRNLKQGLDSIPPKLRRMLELSVCRTLFEERLPRPLIVSGTVERIKVEFGSKLAGVSNAVLRRITEEPSLWPDPIHEPVAHLAASTSHPEWIVARWLERWDFDRTRDLLMWNNKRPSIWLRWNTLNADLSEARRLLRSTDSTFETKANHPLYFRLMCPFFPAPAEFVQQGYFTVQDPSASLAVLLMNPKPGMNILDLCAAPGGKTTLIAQLLMNEGEIVAVDSSADRMQRLGETLSRLNITNLRAFIQDGRSFLHEDKEAQFDAVLVDVPCSGLGVLSRRADLRWRRKPEDIQDMVFLQRALIRAGAKNVKPGGILVYSTCTVEPEENQQVINEFMQENPHFILDEFRGSIPDIFFTDRGTVATYSPRDGIDGVYAVRMIRTE